jgi:hypothetical protein
MADAPKDDVAAYEQELAGYLQERIRPGLNSGAIPLLARSIAKEIAHREHPNGTSQEAEVEDDPSAEADDELSAEEDHDDSTEADDEASVEDDAEADEEDDDEDSADNGQLAFEDEMHELQADLGEDWILRFSVQGDDAWLTAEKDDGSQRVEAPTAEVLVEAVELLNEGGGRST